MADSITAFLGKTAKMGEELARLDRTMAEQAALAIKASVLTAMSEAGVKNGRLRGVGKKGAKIGVRYDIQGRKNSALIRATGPFQLIERDTKAHRVPKLYKNQFSATNSPLLSIPKVSRSAKRGKIAIPGVGVRAWANHPGTKGKHPWDKGVVAGIAVQERAAAVALTTALRRAYK